MTEARKHAHISRPVPPPIPDAHEDVDDEPLTEAEIAAIAAYDGTYIAWEDIKAELGL